MNSVRFNPAYATDVLPKDRFDAAIKEAVERNHQMRVEYERNELAMQFARIARQLRQERNLTQSDIASEANVPQSFITKLELGNQEPGKSFGSVRVDPLRLIHTTDYMFVGGTQSGSGSLSGSRKKFDPDSDPDTD